MRADAFSLASLSPRLSLLPFLSFVLPLPPSISPSPSLPLSTVASQLQRARKSICQAAGQKHTAAAAAMAQSVIRSAVNDQQPNIFRQEQGSQSPALTFHWKLLPGGNGAEKKKRKTQQRKTKQMCYCCCLLGGLNN